MGTSNNDNRDVEAGINPSANAIVDVFTFLPISRQRKWQLRKAEVGCCTKCGDFVPAEVVMTKTGFVEKIFKQCLKCRKDNRARQKLYRTYCGDA